MCTKSVDIEWIPDDVAFKIASFLGVSDVCSLGSCSLFWRDLCSSDHLWMSMFKDRWPLIDPFHNCKQYLALRDEITKIDARVQRFSPLKEWKICYSYLHKVMTERAHRLVESVKQCSPFESLEAKDYLRGIGDLHSMQFGFMDIQLFLLTAKQGVLINLIALHYLMLVLRIPVDEIIEALHRCRSFDRYVCVRWWKLGRWTRGFRLNDECHFRSVSLGDLAMAKEEEVLGVLQRGVVYEVLRVQITADLSSCAWTYHYSHSQ